MPHTELTKQAKDSIFYHNFLLAKGGFKPTNLTGLTLWLDDPSLAANIIEDGSNRVSQWTDRSGNGNHFTQSTGLDQPLRTADAIIFDGVSEFLSGSAHIANFAADTEGEFFFVSNRVADVFISGYFTLSKVGTEIRFIEAITTGIQSFHNSASLITGTIAPGNFGINHIHNISSDGSAYKFQYDGVDDAVSAGVDNGDWLGDVVGLTDFNLAHRIEVAVFQNVSFSSIIYYNRQLTDAERLNVTIFLNNRFNIF